MSSAEPVWTDRRVVADLMLRNPADADPEALAFAERSTVRAV